MAFEYLRAADTLSGQAGRITFLVDGNVEDGGMVRSFEATFTKNKAEVRTIGNRATQHKSTGWNGTFTMTLFYITSLFRKQAETFAHTGRDNYFNITCTNDDQGSSVGMQTAVLINCNVDSVVIAKLDADADVLDEDMDGTFDDFTILDEFNQPIAV